MNNFSNFISDKIKTFRDSDPPWMNDDIKNKIKLYHQYLRHKRNNEDFAKLEYLPNEIDNLLSKSKKEYYQNINRKLNDPSVKPGKTYWPIMKTFFNWKNVPVIRPLLFNDAFVTEFQEKTNIFISFFSQYKLVLKNSVLPREFTYMTEEQIQSITFIEWDVIKIIRAFDVNKAHGHNNTPVGMIKLCTNSVAHPLALVFPLTLWLLVHLLANGKEQIMFQFIRRMINK